MAFSWNTLYKKLGFTNSNLPKGTDSWKNALNNLEQDNNLLFSSRLLALSYFDGMMAGGYGEKKVSQIGEIAERLGFTYTTLYNHRQNITNGLHDYYDVQLLINAADHAQYLRTILRYSGAMYVYFARLVAERIRDTSPEKCTNYEVLKKLFEEKIHLFTNVNNNQDENSEQETLLEDLVLFFKSLIDSYCQYHIFFTAEDIRNASQNRIQLPIAQKIYREMLKAVTGNDKQDLNRLVTRPQLSVNSHGKDIYVLPDEGHFSSEIVKDAYAVGFEFTLKNQKKIMFRYVKEKNGGFILRTDNNPWPEIDLTEKISLIVCQNNGNLSEPEDVSIQGHGFILFCTQTSQENKCLFKVDKTKGNDGIIQNDSYKLWANGRFKVVNFSDSELTIIASGEDKDKNLSLDEYGCFIVPPDTYTVRIDDIVFEVKNDVENYLDLDLKLKYFEKAGARMFFAHKPCPLLLDNFTDLESLSVVYSVPAGKNTDPRDVDVFKDEWNIPEDCLWVRGRLEIRQNKNVLLRRAITFTPSFDIEELEKDIDISINKDVNVKIGNETIPLHVEAKKDKIRFEHHGFNLLFPLRRTGVYLSVNEEMLPLFIEKPGNTPVIQIAKADFEKMKCRLNTGENKNPVIFSRDNNHPVVLYDKEYSGSRLDELIEKNTEEPKNENSIYTFVFFEGNLGGQIYPHITSVYKFQLFNPLKTPVLPPKPTPICQERTGTSLLVKYNIPYSYCNYQKKLIYVPAHKQDEQPVCIDISTENISHKRNEIGHCIETVRIDDFYARQIDWGKGLLCFIVRQRSGFNNSVSYELMSPGFFVKAPDDLETEITDDPYGLRNAFALADHKEIDRITDTQVPEQRNWIRAYYDSIQNVFKKIKGCEVYLNAFRNCIKKQNGELLEISGYIFSAGWYTKELYQDNMRRDNFILQWSYLLIPYSDLNTNVKLKKPDFSSSSNICKFLRSNLHETDKQRLYTLVKSVLGKRPQEDKNAPFIEQIDSLSFSQLVESICKKYKDGISLEILKEQMEQVTYRHPIDEAIELLEIVYRSWDDYDKNRITIDKISSANSDAWQYYQKQNPKVKKDIMHTFRRFFKDYKDMPCRFYGGYDFGENQLSNYDTHPSYLGKKDIENFVIEIGKELHNWRKNPTLEGAQKLREILISLKEIDDNLSSSMYLSGVQICPISFLDIINTFSMSHRQKELNQ